MATLRVEAKPSGGLRQYRIAVDGHLVPMRSDNKGAVAVFGTCGDGSEHLLDYTLVGPAGDSLAVRILCDGNTVCEAGATISPEGEPYAADWKRFRL